MGSVLSAQRSGVGTLTLARVVTARVGAAAGWEAGATAGARSGAENAAVGAGAAATSAGAGAGAGAGAAAWQGSEGSPEQTAVQLPDTMALSVVASTTVQPLQTAS